MLTCVVALDVAAGIAPLISDWMKNDQSLGLRIVLSVSLPEK